MIDFSLVISKTSIQKTKNKTKQRMHTLTHITS